MLVPCGLGGGKGPPNNSVECKVKDSCRLMGAGLDTPVVVAAVVVAADDDPPEAALATEDRRRCAGGGPSAESSSSAAGCLANVKDKRRFRKV